MFADRMDDVNRLQMIPGIIVFVVMWTFVLAIVAASVFVLWCLVRPKKEVPPRQR